MSFRFSKKVAARYLWSKRSEAFITMITLISVVGVAIGVMVINITMSIMTGFEYELREKILATDSHILLRRVGGKISDWKAVAERIMTVPGLDSVSAFTHNQALLRTDSSSSGLLIRGIQRGSAAEKQLVSYLENGRGIESLYEPQLVEIQDENGELREITLSGLIAGRELLRSHGILIGTPVALLSSQVSSTPLGLVPKFKRFVLSGSYRSGLVNYESGLAYMALEEAQKFFRLGDAVSGFEIRVHEIDKAPELAREIKKALGGFQRGFYTQDWTQINKPLWDAIRLEKTVYFIVLLLIIVMASFSIISTLVLLVMEKRGDIAILRTMGAKTRDIGNIFRMQGALIGVLGTGLGLILGLIGCVVLREYGFPLDERIFQISQVPVRMEFANFALVAVASFLICFVATLYPARRASRLQPTEILRYE